MIIRQYAFKWLDFTYSFHVITTAQSLGNAHCLPTDGAFHFQSSTGCETESTEADEQENGECVHKNTSSTARISWYVDVVEYSTPLILDLISDLLSKRNYLSKH